MNKFSYIPKGVCSRKIDIEIEDDIIVSVKYSGGCAGNTQGVAKLVQGRHIDEVISLLEGTICRGGTSCPDQLAKAIELYLAENN